MTEFKVEVLNGYGSDPDIIDVVCFTDEDRAEAFANETKPCRIAKVINGQYYYRRYGKWERENNV